MLDNELIKEVLEQRGITKEQLTPLKQDLNWKELTDTARQTAMDIKFKKKYYKFGVLYDPDVDGLFAGHIMEDYLHRTGIPKTSILRFMNSKKTHGFSMDFIDFVKENELECVFVVDAGSSDILKFHEHLPNVRVIVLDHHEFETHVLPSDTLVTKLNVHDYDYLPEISGSGVTYRFVEALNKFFDIDITNYEYYVGLTVISDVCKMTVPENRYYVTKLYEAKTINPFFDAYKEKFFYGSHDTLYGFKMIPHLNALIRIGEEQKSMEFVNNMEDVTYVNRVVDEYTKTREIQEIEKEKIMKMSQKIETPYCNVLLRRPANEMKTLNGLVANKVMGDNGKSTLVLSLGLDEQGNNIWGGSFRGSTFANDELEPFGFTCMGHAHACGVLVSPENLRNFIDKFEPLTKDVVVKNYDLELDLATITDSKNSFAFAEFNEKATGNLSEIRIKITNSLAFSSKMPVGQTGKVWRIVLGESFITDFTDQKLKDIKELIVKVEFDKFYGIKLVRI